jgi:hypothetical protein
VQLKNRCIPQSWIRVGQPPHDPMAGARGIITSTGDEQVADSVSDDTECFRALTGLEIVHSLPVSR